MVVPTIGTLMMCFFASSTPLRIASGTSPALPRPAPTCPAPSPTTTIALKLKRRPPLTTLATRLIWTTRSSSVSLFGSILGMGLGCSCSGLEVEAGFARRVGERTDAAVIAEAGAVEDDLVDAGGLGAFGNQPTDDLGLLRLRAAGVTQALLERRGAGDRPAGAVVDDLCVDLVEAAENGKSRTSRRAGQAQTDPLVALCAGRAAAHGAHFLPPILPALPALRRMTSPA